MVKRFIHIEMLQAALLHDTVKASEPNITLNKIVLPGQALREHTFIFMVGEVKRTSFGGLLCYSDWSSRSFA